MAGGDRGQTRQALKSHILKTGSRRVFSRESIRKTRNSFRARWGNHLKGKKKFGTLHQRVLKMTRQQVQNSGNRVPRFEAGKVLKTKEWTTMKITGPQQRFLKEKRGVGEVRQMPKKRMGRIATLRGA